MLYFPLLPHCCHLRTKTIKHKEGPGTEIPCSTKHAILPAAAAWFTGGKSVTLQVLPRRGAEMRGGGPAGAQPCGKVHAPQRLLHFGRAC